MRQITCHVDERSAAVFTCASCGRETVIDVTLERLITGATIQLCPCFKEREIHVEFVTTGKTPAIESIYLPGKDAPNAPTHHA